MKLILSIFSFFILTFAFGQGSYQLAVLKYSGGGDYYANPTAVPNLVKFANQQLNANINPEVPYVDVGSSLLFTYPFVHMTGHGNVVFSNSERENLRNYLIGGGFLHIDDNYGMDQYIRPELEKLFPNFKLVELPYNHPIFNQKYKFNGLPKIHEHDGERAQAFGIIIEGRLALLYTYETDLGDGWEDITVHSDTQENHEKALKMGLNILQFALINGGLE
ncbi:DUF4159 domain-containing protein [Brumimicrobium glaciale]|uniref:DUF4159 domain-containing protein n=1 Tax=Brumimicrobium glaciale TaxID=200475 RepID=A0A4Q4KMW7_9FLAO|nr:DUF4159 domain-containing protein [Brumimicrobium glaciale]RYM34682.1 DUF4159 domain-containing protein [Brumimicrobium glaciale]